MIIPTSPAPTPGGSSYALLSIFADDGDNSGGGSTIQRWSSFIGIVTAIVGNILISFALNIQRYAHIRINREREERWKAEINTRYSGDTVYGTRQGEGTSAPKGGVSAGGADAPYRDEEEEGDGGENADETDPLTRSFASHASGDSHSTLQGAEKDLSAIPEKSYLRSPYWWAGIVLMTTGEAGNFLAYGFAPASIVSPLGVVALVSNCIIAPFMLKERFRKQDAVGVLVAVAGAVTVVLSAKTSEDKLGPGEIWGSITRWEFETYLGITAACILVLMWASNRYGDRSILIDLGLVGLFGGYTALSTKGVASLLSYTFWRVVTFPVTYLLIFILVGSALMQIKYVNRALRRFNSTMVIPTQFVLFTLSVIIGSAVLYRDFEKTTAQQAGKFVGGCLMTFLGVYFITSGRTRADSGDSTPLEIADEEAINLVDEEGRYTDQPRMETNEDGQIVWKKPDGTTHVNGSDKHAEQHLLDTTFDPSSHASYIPSEPPTPTPRRQKSDTPSLPSISITPGATPSISNSPVSLTDNPWIDTTPGTSLPSRPPPPVTLAATISHPVLPSQIQSSPTTRPITPRNPSDSALAVDPRLALPHHDRQTPDTHHTTAHPRRSITQFLPGPLVAPLSGSLSAVVADELLRALDAGSPASSTKSPLRRGSHGHRHHRPTAGARGKISALVFGSLRKAKSQRMRGDALGEYTDDPPALLAGAMDPRSRSVENALLDADVEAGEGDEAERSAAKRRKSLSAALSEMFRGRAGGSGAGWMTPRRGMREGGADGADDGGTGRVEGRHDGA